MTPSRPPTENLRTIAADISQSLDRIREAMGDDLSLVDAFRWIDLKLMSLRSLADQLEK